MENVIETHRLILRSWRESDAESLYRYAKDPAVGPSAGWPPHSSVEESREIIRTVFSAPEIYAVVLKEKGEPIGCCGLVSAWSRPCMSPDDAELGYWIGKPYWGQGLIPEAIMAIAAHARGALGKKTLWIAFYDGNDNSRRVAEKCGFVYDHSETSGQSKEHLYARR